MRPALPTGRGRDGRTGRGEAAARLVERLCHGGIAILLAIAVLAGGQQASAPRQGLKMVVFAPTASRQDQFHMISTARGLPVRAGRLPNVMVALPGDEAFGRRVRGQGAWLVLEAGGAGGCLGWL